MIHPALNNPPIPNVDIVFALSSASSNAAEVLRHSKAILKSLIDTYGMEKIKLALIVYGSTPEIRANFRETANFPDANLKTFIDGVSMGSGEPNLQKALVKAEMVFKTAMRPNAKKILVVISDKK